LGIRLDARGERRALLIVQANPLQLVDIVFVGPKVAEGRERGLAKFCVGPNCRTVRLEPDPPTDHRLSCGSGFSLTALRFQRFPARKSLGELALELFAELSVGLHLLATLLVIIAAAHLCRERVLLLFQRLDFSWQLRQLARFLVAHLGRRRAARIVVATFRLLLRRRSRDGTALREPVAIAADVFLP